MLIPIAHEPENGRDVSCRLGRSDMDKASRGGWSSPCCWCYSAATEGKKGEGRNLI